MVFHELASYLTVNVPLVGFIRTEIGKDELCAFLVEIFIVIFRNLGRTMRRFVSRIVTVLLVYQTHIKRHLVRVVGGNQHLGLFFRFRQRLPVYVGRISGFSELYQFLNENFLLGSGRYVIELFVEFRPVNPYVFSRFVIGYLRVEIGEFRHFDKVAETFLLHDLVGYGKFKVRAFLRIDSRPTVKTRNPLPLHFFRTEIFEKEIEFGQAVGNGRTGQEGSPQIPARALLYGTDGEEHVHGLHASFGIAHTGNPRMACVEHQVLEIV